MKQKKFHMMDQTRDGKPPVTRAGVKALMIDVFSQSELEDFGGIQGSSYNMVNSQVPLEVIRKKVDVAEKNFLYKLSEFCDRCSYGCLSKD